jgi:predicted nucleic acid-binding protein
MLVLDTNVVSEMMRPAPNPRIAAWLSRQPASEVHLTALTVGEIGYGLSLLPPGRRRSTLERRFAEVLERGFADRVLAFDAAAALAYGPIMAARRAEGRPMSVVDGQIAAIAQVAGAVLASRNLADFDGCGLRLVNPFDD